MGGLKHSLQINKELKNNCFSHVSYLCDHKCMSDYILKLKL